MSISAIRTLMIGVTIGVLATSVSRLALGSTLLEQIGILSNNEGIVVDVATFKVVRGAASSDQAAQIAALSAKQVTDGAIVFRTGDKLYIVDARPGDAPQMMRGNWPPQTVDDFNSIFTNRMR
jgi:hypothetical protein